MKIDELNRIFASDRLSDSLPWLAFKDGLYFNADNTAGVILECAPVPFAGENVRTALTQIYDNPAWPAGTVLQFILYADPHLALDNYLAMRQVARTGTRQDREDIRDSQDFLRNWARTYCNFLNSRRFTGVRKDLPVPLRNFRCFFTAKAPCPVEDFARQRGVAARVQAAAESAASNLKTAGVWSMSLGPERLIGWMHRLLNPGHGHLPDKFHDPGREIRRQIIEADTDVRTRKEHVEFDGWFARTLTPLHYNREPDPYDVNLLIGDLNAGALRQITCPFMLTLNLIIEDRSAKISAKGNITMWQGSSLASHFHKLAAKQQEFSRAMEDMRKGVKYYGGFLTLTLLSEDRDRLDAATAEAQSIWEMNGFKLQREAFLNLPFLLMSLPFGFYATKQVKDRLNRLKSAPSGSWASVTPIQADHPGTGGEEPVMLFLTRRGQKVEINLLKSQTNYNAMVAATTGAGKSFFANYMITSYLSCGGEVYVIDVGGSYKNLCETLHGQYMEFDKDSRLSLNVFGEVDYAMLTGDTASAEQASTSLTMYVRLLAQMANPSRLADDYESRLIENVLIEAYRNLPPDEIMCVDRILDVLAEKQAELEAKGIQDRRPHDLMTKLQKYGSKGLGGRWFEGRMNVEFDNPFVVLELEQLNIDKDLREVVLLLLTSIIDHKLYFSKDYSVPKLIIIDEAWDLLTGANTGKFIETLYRRARKYKGSVTTITQSILDYYRNPVGEAIVSNAEWLFLLKQKGTDLARAMNENKITATSFERRLIESVTTVPKQFSEIYIRSSDSSHLVRLVVDPHTAYLYETRPNVRQHIRQCQGQGLSLAEAIDDCVRHEI